MKPIVSSPLVVTPQPGCKLWRLVEDLHVMFYGIEIFIPEGTVTDFASVPKWMKPLFPDSAICSVASIVHDRLYQRGVTSKWMADAIFFSMLKYEPQPVGWLCRSAMWIGVWAFGWLAWWSHRRRERKDFLSVNDVTEM